MGLEKVKESVLADADQKARGRVKAAESEARRILYLAKKQASQSEKSFNRELAEEAEMLEKRESASSKLESKKMNLAFRKEFADEIFETVKKNLEKLPETKRANHIKSLLNKANAEIDAAAIYCSEKDAKHVDNKYLIEESDMLGGIMAESEDGTLRVDYSYETMLKQLQDSLTPKINKMLFEKNEP